MLTRLAMWIIPSLDNDMQTHLSLSYPIKSGYIGIKDAQYAETYEKNKFPISIFLHMVKIERKLPEKKNRTGCVECWRAVTHSSSYAVLG